MEEEATLRSANFKNKKRNPALTIQSTFDSEDMDSMGDITVVSAKDNVVDRKKEERESNIYFDIEHLGKRRIKRKRESARCSRITCGYSSPFVFVDCISYYFVSSNSHKFIRLLDLSLYSRTYSLRLYCSS